MSSATGITDDFISKSQAFSSSYDKPPVVHLSVEWIYANGDMWTYHSVQLDSVDTKGFVMRCVTTNKDRIKALRASWISVPSL